MENFIQFIQKHKWKGLLALVVGSIAILLLSSCNVAKLSSTRNEVADKHIETSTTIELEK